MELRPETYLNVSKAPVLCYVTESRIAFFTSLPLEEQSGDDWDDAPYWTNASPPIERTPGQLTEVRFSIDLAVPEEFANGNFYSVNDINLTRALPWLRRHEWSKTQVDIWAGTPLDVFLAIVATCGDVYLNLPTWQKWGHIVEANYVPTKWS